MSLVLCVCGCPCRDQDQVLQEDREKLLLMQPMQPWFTPDQKKELAEVHPWIRQHTVPQEINTQVENFSFTSGSNICTIIDLYIGHIHSFEITEEGVSPCVRQFPVILKM